MNTEQQLLERISQGDRKAQRELYDRYAGTAMAVAMRLVANADAARDVLQEAFIKVFTRMNRFDYRGEGTLKAWVMRVVSNEAIDWLRQRQQLMAESPMPYDLPDEEPPDVDDIPPEALQRMIERLPSGYRVVFCLYAIEQKSHREIAQLLGIRENSSASQFLRARRMMAKMIDDYKQREPV